jgi:hypothetical protein
MLTLLRCLLYSPPYSVLALLRCLLDPLECLLAHLRCLLYSPFMCLLALLRCLLAPLHCRLAPLRCLLNTDSPFTVSAGPLAPFASLLTPST